jgi:hypothetical protein
MCVFSAVIKNLSQRRKERQEKLFFIKKIKAGPNCKIFFAFFAFFAPLRETFARNFLISRKEKLFYKKKLKPDRTVKFSLRSLRSLRETFASVLCEKLF